LFNHVKPSVANTAVCLEPITAARLADNLLARASLFLGKDFGAILINSCFIEQTSFSFSKKKHQQQEILTPVRSSN